MTAAAKNGIRNLSVVGLYSIIHAIVDFACGALVVMQLSEQLADRPNMVFAVVVLYDFFAFAMQLPIGIYADVLDKNALVSAYGCVIIAVAYALRPVGILAAIVAGIGNALFHVGGGIDVLNISNRKATFPGIYVATGAMGLFLGSNGSKLAGSGGKDRITEIAVIALVFSAALLICLYRKTHGKYAIRNMKVVVRDLSRKETVFMWCMLVTIGIRGGLGLVMNFTWKNSFAIGLVAVGAVVIGKMLGGIFGDLFGWRRMTVASLLFSAVLFIFAYDNMICGIAALLLFNMSMPVTLTALANRYETQRGMAFGMTTAALFFGALPVFFGFGKWLFLRPVVITVTVLSAAAVWYGLRCYEQAEQESTDA